MKVLLVNGSPHKDGCTNRALEEIKNTLQEEGISSDIFWIGVKPISGCIACKKCANLGKCYIDDKVNLFVELAKDYDGFIFGSPVHYAAISGQMKSFMDRVFYSASCTKKDYFRYKPVSSIISARRAGTVCAYDEMNKYFGITEMPIISSRYWNMVHGLVKEDVEKDLEGLQTMRVLARNMAYFLKCIELGKQKIALPKKEKTEFTNFIR